MTNNAWRLALLVGALAVPLLLASCGDDDGGAAADQHSDADSHDLEVTIQSSDLLKFEPGEIRVRTGQRVRLVLDNVASTTLHDFSVETMDADDVMVEGDAHVHGEAADYALHVAAVAGNQGVLLFTPGAAGQYEFFCSVEGHAAAGMKGMLIVE